MANMVSRSEYPRMQFRREQSWLNLNGTWKFAFDPGKSGIDRKLYEHPESFPDRIMVPFPPESSLSGLKKVDFCEQVFYSREFTVPCEWKGKLIFLNFGAVDYRATVWINGIKAGHHFGGSSSFSIDITSLVQPGVPCCCTVCALDEVRSEVQGVGKQSRGYYSGGCNYTRVTGIWQTVWVEAVAPSGLKSCRIVPDFDNSSVSFTPEFHRLAADAVMRIKISDNGRCVAESMVRAAEGISLTLALPGFKSWSTSSPFLYDVALTVMVGGQEADHVESYFGMRKISIEGNRILLNNKPIFLRFVLDQGFYPDGIWTAPSDDELRMDIERAKAVGFNGARLHQKVFEERYHYWADRLGYLTWGEYPSWGITLRHFEAKYNFLNEWRGVVCRDRNHPSIIAWTPFNETGALDDPTEIAQQMGFPGKGAQIAYAEFMNSVYELTKSLDPIRPVNDASGYTHSRTDLWTVHCYCPGKAELAAELFPGSGKVRIQNEVYSSSYSGQPYINDEWGGFKYVPQERRSTQPPGWGYYGMALQTPAEFIAKIKEQCEVMVEHSECSGYCYTQLTDIEQEQNGIYCYDRTEKAPAAEFRKCFSLKPEWSLE